MAGETKSSREEALAEENIDLREQLTQAGLDAARILEQAGIDATQNDTARRLQRLLLEEVHHRIKNMLTTVLAITSQSLRAAEDLTQGRLAIESRLMALGRTQDLLLQASWTNTKLTKLILTAVEPFDSDNVGRFVVQDVDIQISADAVLPFTMSLNELCTNAVKYGALSNASGRVEITPTIDEEARRFNLRWTETGGPAVKEPTRRGFGTRLIGRLAEQLQGDARLKYEPGGLVYELDIPLTALGA